MAENQDLSKIIGIIMENPDLIARIKSLADNTEVSADSSEIKEALTESSENKSKTDDDVSAASVTYSKAQSKKRRRELLSALKPYVRSERAKAIDTMLSVIDVLDVMKVR